MPSKAYTAVPKYIGSVAQELNDGYAVVGGKSWTQ